jgi:hypothetical protein
VGRPYTERLLRVDAATGTHYYLVPDAKRAILTNIDLANLGSGAAVVYVLIATYVVGFWSLAAGASVHLETRAVAYAAEQVAIQVSSGSIWGQLTGYVFDDP